MCHQMAPAVARLRWGVFVLFALAASTCAHVGEPTSMEKPGSPAAASVVELGCDGGVAHTTAPVVVAQQDGVHLTANDLGAWTIRFLQDDEPLNITIEPTSAARRFQLAPETYGVRCVIGSSPLTPTTTSLTVVDPNGWYHAPSLACSCACQYVMSGPEHWLRAPIGAIHRWLRLRRTDLVVPSGYIALTSAPHRDEMVWYVIVRNGQSVGRVGLISHGSLFAFSTCFDLLPNHGPSSW